jgi:hypothetical protein
LFVLGGYHRKGDIRAEEIRAHRQPEVEIAEADVRKTPEGGFDVKEMLENKIAEKWEDGNTDQTPDDDGDCIRYRKWVVCFK